MGQAKKRGNFEQRVEQAREAFNSGIEVKKQEIEELDRLEKRQIEALGNFVNQRILPQMERQHGALMRADYSLIALRAKETA